MTHESNKTRQKRNVRWKLSDIESECERAQNNYVRIIIKLNVIELEMPSDYQNQLYKKSAAS